MTTPPAHRSLPVLTGTAKFWIPGLLTFVAIVIAALAGLEGYAYVLLAFIPGISLGAFVFAIVSNLYARRTGRTIEFMAERTLLRHLSDRTRERYGISESRVGEWYLFLPLQLVLLLGVPMLFMVAAMAWAPGAYA